MARKLLFTILILSVAALELLGVRQKQINTVDSMTLLHREINEQIALIDTLRIEIEFACSPSLLGTIHQSEIAHDGLE